MPKEYIFTGWSYRSNLKIVYHDLLDHIMIKIMALICFNPINLVKVLVEKGYFLHEILH